MPDSSFVAASPEPQKDKSSAYGPVNRDQPRILLWAYIQVYVPFVAKFEEIAYGDDACF